VTEQIALSRPAGRGRLANAGLALSIVLAVVFAVIVEDLLALMLANSATWGELAVLLLFAVPLLTGWAAIAISLSGRPMGLRLGVAALLLLVPPLVLVGVWHA
jgi:hypothetical protein